MKLTSLLFGSTAVLVSGLALVAYDMTYTSNGPVKPNETKQMTVDIPAGKSTVEVWEEKNARISCTFLQHGTNQVVYQANNVGRCVGHTPALTLPTTMLARITNEGDKDAYLRVWVHDSK